MGGCAVLHDHPEFTLVAADLPFGEPGLEAELIAPFGDPALLKFSQQVPLSRCRRIFPWHGGEGHFLALLHREGDVAITPKSTAIPLDRSGTVSAAQALYNECFKASPNGEFVRVGDTVRLLPPVMPAAPGVHILCAGVTAAQVMQGRTLRVEPAHALFQSADPQDCRRLIDLSHDDARVLAFLRGEEIAVDTSDGWTGVAVDGIMTGFGKAVGGRLKNRYPKGLRLLHG